ncbi:hypothetical protein Pint_10495 [Pistacia integerrima]|uniref:Uncharacterized protein n=1 Tax=Pistacia integerrima TaxID=434235 RepID=A0ACC0XJ85_9ROSI|nr:hypothetical protein Pint_10495 [Pistacia integerrima]
MVLPVIKLGTLVLKTLSKPLAAKLKQQAAFHPRFRQFIIDIAQANHRITTRMQRRIHSHATDVEIRPLNEEKAVQAAVDLIGELFIFSVSFVFPATLLVVFAISLSRLGVWMGHGRVVAGKRICTCSRMCRCFDHSTEVAGAAVIFEVQRSARSEARKEEIRKQELEALRQRDENLSREVELLRQKLEELEQLARARGLSGIFSFKPANTEVGKLDKQANTEVGKLVKQA